MNSAKTIEKLAAELRAKGISRSDMVVKIAEACMEWPYAWGAVARPCTVAERERCMRSTKIGQGDIDLIKRHCPILSKKQSKCDGCMYYPGGECTQINDCQGFVKKVFGEAKISLTGGGCTSMYAKHSQWKVQGKIKDMPNVVCCVFKYISSTGKMDHIGIHIGDGNIIHCSTDVRRGKITDKGWTNYAIPNGMDGDVPVVTKPTLRKGSKGDYVVECQQDLISLRYSVGPKGADGIYGTNTVNAVKQFQTDHQLTADGICGPNTWTALDKAVGPQPEPTPETYSVIIHGLDLSQAKAIQANYPGSEIVSEGSGT